MIDSFELISNSSELYIYGAGLAARRLFMDLRWKRPDIRIKGFIDSFKHSGELFTLPIINVADVIDIGKQQVVIASMHYEEIAKGLEERGVLNILAYWKEVDASEICLSLSAIDLCKVKFQTKLPRGISDSTCLILNTHENPDSLKEELPILATVNHLYLFPNIFNFELDAELRRIAVDSSCEIVVIDVCGEQFYLSELLRILTSDYGRSVSVYKLPSRYKMVSLIESKKVMFFGIAKNGSSSAATLLKGLYTKNTHISELCHDIRFSVSVTDKCFADYHKFAVVRNPYDRLASLYTQLMRLDQNEWFNLAFNKILATYSFDSFCRFVGECPDELSDIHFRSQTSFLVTPEGLLEDIELLHMENYAEEMKNFFAMIGEEVEVPHENKSRPDSVDYIKDYYTPELIELVNRRYEQDFINFGYEFL